MDSLTRSQARTAEPEYPRRSRGASTGPTASDATGDSAWRAAINELAAFERASASEGERRAAAWIADRLRQLECRVEIEEGRAHGGYWWPLGLANAIAVAASLTALRRGRARGRRRARAAVAGAVTAAAVWDDVSGGRLWFRRALLPHRSTWNVVAETGDAEAQRTVVLLAHHDAAHSGLVFHPALARLPPKLAPRLHARSGQSVPILYGVWLGPALVGLGGLLGACRLLAAGAVAATGAVAVMADIGARPVVPGANDNLSAVGVLLAIARAVRDRPLRACACCWYRPARRSRSWRACRPSPAGTSPSSIRPIPRWCASNA